ncbi:hypothetical protein Z949_444 [Sulfitobacter guttiformis KCTC 32187]|uniref:Uncharacterized protein n=1 Tax=Sulfitobacter guttiformis TaxID=74349 RepID=A0A420DTU2_9RHOB|nr:hypothetical protein Z949_444 [Sulfitobacter guttiformis KCTC 32187]RKE97741.1 hypothetical protein C8N30_2366 [Sulfitobacter guttiformis]
MKFKGEALLKPDSCYQNSASAIPKPAFDASTMILTAVEGRFFAFSSRGLAVKINLRR